MPQGGLRYNAEAINWEDPTSSAPVCFANVKEEQIKGRNYKQLNKPLQAERRQLFGSCWLGADTCLRVCRNLGFSAALGTCGGAGQS